MSPIPLHKWRIAVWMISNCKTGLSSYEIARALGINQIRWFMLHRTGSQLQNNSFVNMAGNGGEVEVDESFIGGDATP
jgi:hypothetical protein